MTKQILTLRGHHLESLKAFLYAKNNDLPILKRSGYGNKFDLNRDKIYDSILNGHFLIKITTKFDSLCSKCNFKTDGGCVYDHIEYGKVFQRKKYTREIDLEAIKKFNLELGKIYSGKEISAILLN